MGEMSIPDANGANGAKEAEERGALDPRTRTAIVGVAAMGALFAIGASTGWGVRAGVSVAIGALIAVANLYGLARIVGALLGTRGAHGEGDPNSGMWGLLAILKVIGLFGVIWFLLSFQLVQPIGLVVGWGALPIGIALGTFVSDKSERPPSARAKEAPPAGPPAP
jgi:hypothetical protein